VPGFVAPFAVGVVRARHHSEYFRGDAVGVAVVGEDATGCELLGNRELVWAVEDFGGETDHAASEAGEMLTSGQ